MFAKLSPSFLTFIALVLPAVKGATQLKYENELVSWFRDRFWIPSCRASLWSGDENGPRYAVELSLPRVTGMDCNRRLPGAITDYCNGVEGPSNVPTHRSLAWSHSKTRVRDGACRILIWARDLRDVGLLDVRVTECVVRALHCANLEAPLPTECVRFQLLPLRPLRCRKRRRWLIQRITETGKLIRNPTKAAIWVFR